MRILSIHSVSHTVVNEFHCNKVKRVSDYDYYEENILEMQQVFQIIFTEKHCFVVQFFFRFPLNRKLWESFSISINKTLSLTTVRG